MFSRLGTAIGSAIDSGRTRLSRERVRIEHEHRAASAREWQPTSLEDYRVRQLRRLLSAAAEARTYAAHRDELRRLSGADKLADRNALWDAFRSLPLLRKEQVRWTMSDMLVPEPGPVDLRITSGTTGSTALIARPRRSSTLRAALDRRLFDALALPRSFTMAVVVPWREEATVTRGFYDPRITHRRLGFRECEHEIATGQRPGDVVLSSPSVCARLREQGCPTTPVSGWESPRTTRALLGVDSDGPAETAAELYAAAEVTAPIAVRYPDCPRLHVTADAVHVEIVHPRTGQPVDSGVAGEIVVTDLLNASMPFLRYAIGDVGLLAPEQCPCGRCTPTLLLLGRKTAQLPHEANTPDTWLRVETATERHLYADSPAEPHARRHPLSTLPSTVRTALPAGGLAVSIAERYPVAEWADRGREDLLTPEVRRANPQAALAARREEPESRRNPRRKAMP